MLFDSEEVEGDEVSDSTPFMAYREVVCNTMDEEEDLPLAPYQRYVLCPSTFAPGLAGKFRIIVLTDKPLDHAPELLPALNEVKVTGSWAENNAGGCRNFVTWRRNEQYALQLSRAARVSCVLLRHSAEPPSDVALHSKKSKAKPRRKKKDEAAPLIGFVVAAAEHGSAERKRLAIGNDDVVDKTKFVPSVEVAAEFYHDEPGGGLFVVVPSTFEPGELGDYELIVYTDDEAASLRRIEPSTWHLQEAKGEWTRTTAGGCRNNPTWVRNPLYSVRATRASHCQLFLRQAERPAGGADAPEYDGIGFYLTADDGQLSLEDLCCESGFRQQQESSATFELQADVDYLLIPMTYKRGIEMSFEMELYCDTPTLRLHQLGEPEAHGRRLETLENEAALTIQRAMARKQIYRELRAYPPNRERARQMMKEWFGKPTRDNDEGCAAPRPWPSLSRPQPQSQPRPRPHPQVPRHQPRAQRARVRIHPAHRQGGRQGAVLPRDAGPAQAARAQGRRLRRVPLGVRPPGRARLEAQALGQRRRVGAGRGEAQARVDTTQFRHLTRHRATGRAASARHVCSVYCVSD